MNSPAQYEKSLAIIGLDAAWKNDHGADVFESRSSVSYSGQSRALGGLCAPGLDVSWIDSARRALLDAGVGDLIQTDNRRIALLVANHSNASIDANWPGPFYDLSVYSLPLVNAIYLSEQLLHSRQVDATVFAASVDASWYKPGGISRAGRENIFGFDNRSHEIVIGEGCGAVVWMLKERALNENRRIYAVIRSLAFREISHNSLSQSDRFIPPAVSDILACCQEALDTAGVTARDIGYIEASACGLDAIDGIEIAGLVQTYRKSGPELNTAIGSVQTNYAYLGLASGLAGMIHAALCVYHRTLPGVQGWNGPKLPALWRYAPFYIPPESRPWFEARNGPGRLSGVNLVGQDGSCAHIILADVSEQPLRSNALCGNGFYLLPVTGETQEDLITQLGALRQTLTEHVRLDSLSLELFNAACIRQNTPFAISIVGHTCDELLREIDMALKALPGLPDRVGEWQTPLGSYYTANPVGQLGGVAFVYPGAFNSYPGAAVGLFHLFPELYQHADTLTSDMGRSLRECKLYPRRLQPISNEDLAAIEADLLADPIAMLISGTAMSVLYTHLVKDIFGIQPAAAFGYSLGETAMMYAAGIWMGHADEAAERLEQSQVFRERLAGSMQAVRDYWDTLLEVSENSQPMWSNYLVMADPDKVRAALEKEHRVYLTHINTPRQVVIGGDLNACQRVLAELHCSSLRAPFDYALHCDVMRSEYAELALLHSYPVENQVGLKMYSAANYGLLHLEQPEISHKLAHMLTTSLDFPRLVKKVYADGARVFIEVGAGSNCARWIDEILKTDLAGKLYPHLAVSMNRRGSDDYHTIVRVLARLFSHRVSVNMAPLYRRSNQTAEVLL